MSRRVRVAARPFLIYAAGVVVAALLTAYPIDGALRASGVQMDYATLVHRLLKLFALVGLWPLMRSLGATHAADWGFSDGPGRFFAAVLLGLGLGVATLGVLVGALIALGVHYPSPNFVFTSRTVAVVIAKAIVAALFIALLEEVWFRGALYGGLRRRFSVRGSVAATSLLYGAVHLVDSEIQISVPDPWSATQVLAGSFGHFANVGYLGSLAALIAAGVLLALIRERSGNIALCIGLHAGWVWVIKAIRKTTDAHLESPWMFLAGDYDTFIGWLAAGWFTLLAVVYYRRPIIGRHAGGG